MRGTTVWLPADLVELIDEVRERRMDPTRSDTLRYLILRALCDMSLIPEDMMKALGFQTSKAGPQRRGRGRSTIGEKR
jgi:metal-responsive CopG/Arc/MetJ family transcriptional regulator